MPLNGRMDSLGDRTASTSLSVVPSTISTNDLNVS
ncbi:hypothetical protein PF010_g32240 [Phytophthora fragariae]|uniref:Uncharacterized protein n=1 Tax=Phytophthora fragariae TaxID=53985 RepID=A0A6A3PQ34_9STRA|nr:hypothetical protein PF003_g40638 [Phytophthora fragariae]KAE8875223.1 hypothetical protein PF003_g40633 [Phytophthora fragariae]KAE8875250.1 hypothetical protein PF003_g40622 [Phytophthora fragariae]KAE8922544.1 hypothetical protein PF009_g27192 [Phytophthora fragariae]KAE9054905.1 hypothetical protein PF010_g32340 [Phytophthora fragariae]